MTHQSILRERKKLGPFNRKNESSLPFLDKNLLSQHQVLKKIQYHDVDASFIAPYV